MTKGTRTQSLLRAERAPQRNNFLTYGEMLDRAHRAVSDSDRRLTDSPLNHSDGKLSDTGLLLNTIAETQQSLAQALARHTRDEDAAWLAAYTQYTADDFPSGVQPALPIDETMDDTTTRARLDELVCGVVDLNTRLAEAFLDLSRRSNTPSVTQALQATHDLIEGHNKRISKAINYVRR